MLLVLIGMTISSAKPRRRSSVTQAKALLVGQRIEETHSGDVSNHFENCNLYATYLGEKMNNFFLTILS